MRWSQIIFCKPISHFNFSIDPSFCGKCLDNCFSLIVFIFYSILWSQKLVFPMDSTTESSTNTEFKPIFMKFYCYQLLFKENSQNFGTICEFIHKFVSYDVIYQWMKDGTMIILPKNYDNKVIKRSKEKSEKCIKNYCYVTKVIWTCSFFWTYLPL